MPGIVGIVDFNQDSASIDKQLRRMVRILNHTSPSDEEVYVSEHASLGAVKLKIYSYQELIAEDEITSLAFWGYLWDQEDLKKRTGLNFENIRDVSIGRLLLRLYNKEGIDGLCNLNGRFVIAIWNKAEKVLTLVNDHYGFCKLFYWVNSQRILFASEYKAIIWHQDFPRKIDQQAWLTLWCLATARRTRHFLKTSNYYPRLRWLPSTGMETCLFENIGTIPFTAKTIPCGWKRITLINLPTY